MKCKLNILAACVFFVVCGCDSTESDPSRTELLTAEAWLLDSFDIDPDDDNIEITLAERYVFEADGTVMVTFDGGQSLTSAWQFIDGESRIRLDANGSSQTLEILQLGEDVFRFRIVALDVTITATLVHG